MSEYKGQISGLIEKMSTQAESRILKIQKIKEKFESKLASFTLQGAVKLDFNAYSSVDIARKEIFGSMFIITKQKSVTIKTNVNIFLHIFKLKIKYIFFWKFIKKIKNINSLNYFLSSILIFIKNI